MIRVEWTEIACFCLFTDYSAPLVNRGLLDAERAGGLGGLPRGLHAGDISGVGAQRRRRVTTTNGVVDGGLLVCQYNHLLGEIEIGQNALLQLEEGR